MDEPSSQTADVIWTWRREYEATRQVYWLSPEWSVRLYTRMVMRNLVPRHDRDPVRVILIG